MTIMTCVCVYVFVCKHFSLTLTILCQCECDFWSVFLCPVCHNYPGLLPGAFGHKTRGIISFHINVVIRLTVTIPTGTVSIKPGRWSNQSRGRKGREGAKRETITQSTLRYWAVNDCSCWSVLYTVCFTCWRSTRPWWPLVSSSPSSCLM